jgi:hypothetical protein
MFANLLIRVLTSKAQWILNAALMVCVIPALPARRIELRSSGPVRPGVLSLFQTCSTAVMMQTEYETGAIKRPVSYANPTRMSASWIVHLITFTN